MAFNSFGTNHKAEGVQTDGVADAGCEGSEAIQGDRGTGET